MNSEWRLATRPNNRRLFLGLMLSVLLAEGHLGCGGGGSTPPPAITVSVTPATNTVLASGTAQLTATVTNDPSNKGVTWTLSCSTGSCGSVSPTHTASGVATTYTAPVPPSDLRVTVNATSVADSRALGWATLAVPAITVEGQPNSATVPGSTTAQFTATVGNKAKGLPEILREVLFANEPLIRPSVEPLRLKLTQQVSKCLSRILMSHNGITLNHHMGGHLCVS